MKYSLSSPRPLARNPPDAVVSHPPPPPSLQQQQQQQQVPWNAVAVFTDLQAACHVLSERCLKVSAKWAAEQMTGLPPLPESAVVVVGGHSTHWFSSLEGGVSSTTSSSQLLLDHLALHQETNPAVYYAKTLLELGEYAHAASVLSETPTAVSSSIAATARMPPPLMDLSHYAFYLRAYALYLAGERRKEEWMAEEASTSASSSASSSSTTVGTHTNPYLTQLLLELRQRYSNPTTTTSTTSQLDDDVDADPSVVGGEVTVAGLDAFGLHVYGMVLKACNKVPRGHPAPHTVLMQSILAFPYNWSAWMDLAEIVLRENSDTLERQLEQTLSPLAENFLYHFFCAHLQTENQALSEALAIYTRWLDPALLGGSPYLATQAAVVQYHLRKFQAAKTLLEDVRIVMPYRLDAMDVLSNILYVQEDSVGLGRLAHDAMEIDKYRPETCCIVGNYYSLKQQRAKAIQYFRRALQLDRTFTSAWTLMGHEYVEWKQTAHAMESYRHAVQSNAMDYRAWYGLGQTYELLEMNLYALYYYKRAAQLRPFDARMWTAVGNAYGQLEQIQDAMRAYERALQHDDTEGVATQKLAILYRDQQLDDHAAQCYLQHLRNRFTATGMIPSSSVVSSSLHLVGEGGADGSVESIPLPTLLQGIVVDVTEAEALLFLAGYYRNEKEYDKAALFAGRLLDYPGPEKDQAKALLREIRSRRLEFSP